MKRCKWGKHGCNFRQLWCTQSHVIPFTFLKTQKNYVLSFCPWLQKVNNSANGRLCLTSGRRYFLRRFTTATLGGSASLGSLQSSVAPIRKSRFILSMPLKRKSTSLAWFPSPLSMGCFLRWRYFLLTRSLKEAALCGRRVVICIVTNSSVTRYTQYFINTNQIWDSWSN